MSLLLAVTTGGATNYTLTCAAGAYTYTGQAATLSVAHSLVCAAGAYIYTGQAATLNVVHSLVCSAGAYTYTGNAATLSYVPGTGAVHYTLTCDAGSYVYTGNDTTLAYVAGVAYIPSGGSYRPYRYLSLPEYGKRKDYDEEELKRLVLEAEERNKEEISVLEHKSEQLYREGVKLAEIKSSVISMHRELEKRVNAQLLFDIDLKLKLLETQRRKNMAILLLMAAA